MPPGDGILALGWGKRLPVLLNAPRCKLGKRQIHPRSNGDAWQTLMPTTMSATEKATLRVSRSIACPLPTMRFSNVHRNKNRMQRESIARIARCNRRTGARLLRTQIDHHATGPIGGPVEAAERGFTMSSLFSSRGKVCLVLPASLVAEPSGL
jgi:hypothetical protein